MADPAAQHGPPRMRLVSGRAHLQPARPTPKDMLPGLLSVLSPGTERRHLAATAHGPDRDAGYMGLATTPEGWVLAPAPHGAAFRPTTPGALTVPRGTPPHVAAVARFQLMAALGLHRLPAGTDLHGAVVVGSGPVALGCALALRRRGAEHIRLLTRRPDAPVGRAPAVACTTVVAPASAGLVIDASGRPKRAADLVAPSGTLGLLGTPDESSALSTLTAHRGGWTVVGMHELAPGNACSHQHTYTDAVTWIVEQLDPQLVASWCRSLSGSDAPGVLASLGRAERPNEPVVLFDWSR